MRIGVVGGGQLGRMLAEAGAGFDARFTFLDPSEAACAAVHGRHLAAAWDDRAALENPGRSLGQAGQAGRNGGELIRALLREPR